MIQVVELKKKKNEKKIQYLCILTDIWEIYIRHIPYNIKWHF